MILTLEITGAHATLLGAGSRKVFAGEGGSIGRLPSSAWCLQDSHVSKQHARISVEDGTFFLEDTNSSNGVVLNARKLQVGRRYPLSDGDRIFIDPFEIHVSLSAGTVAPDPLPDRVDVFDVLPRTPLRPARVAVDPFAGLEAVEDPSSGRLPDLPDLSDLNDSNLSPSGDSVIGRIVGARPSAPLRRDHPRAADLESKSVLEDPMPLPPVLREADREGGFEIPPNYVPGSGDSQVIRPSPGHPSRRKDPSGTFAKPSPAGGNRPTRAPSKRVADLPERPGTDDSVAIPAPSPARAAVPTAPAVPAASAAPAAPAEGFINLAETLRAAGLENIPVTPELAQRFGEILRAVVAGLIDTLQVRNSIRDEFRMRHTSFPTGKRNPLKVSVDVDDALHNLLVKRNAAYLEPVAAVEDAFADVRYHQMAMLAGMRDAFDAMLAAFDPKRLEEQFDGMKRGALVPVPAKLRYWELYREKFDGMVSDADRCFQDLFAAEFTAAYEEQLARLKAQHGAPGRDSTS